METTVILESEPINFPNAKKCRANHGLVAAVPCEDMTFGVFKKPVYKKRRRELEYRNRKEAEKINREREKAIFEEYNRNDDRS